MKKALVLLSVLFTIALSAQTKFVDKNFGFTMVEPEGWLRGNNEDLALNLDKLDLDEEALAKIVHDHKGSVMILSLFKYDPATHPGLIPAIQVNVREKHNDDWNEFKSGIVKSAHSFKKLYNDYEFEQEPGETTIAGIKSISFVGKFTLKTDKGEVYRVRSRMYVIPYKDYYFQLNFTDGVLGEDCGKEYDKLIKSIRVKRK